MESLEYKSSSVTIGRFRLKGDLAIPNTAQSVVIFAHGSGSGRHSPRNQFVAQGLQQAGLGTLLMDLLTEEEEAVDQKTGHLRFDIDLLAERLMDATDWVVENLSSMEGLRVGYFGASTGAAAALIAAARNKDPLKAVVSRGGRPDLAGGFLKEVRAPTLLIVGGDDSVVIELNRLAFQTLNAPKEMRIIPRASHLFEEPGTLEQVEKLAEEWFLRFLG